MTFKLYRNKTEFINWYSIFAEKNGLINVRNVLVISSGFMLFCV